MSDDVKPFWVHCGECKHDWIAVYLPMEIRKVAQMIERARCPKCATSSKKIFIGRSSAPAVTSIKGGK
jgi:hypothetical protein